MRKRTKGDDLKQFGSLLMPDEAEEPILAKPVRKGLMDWLSELWATEELEAVGLKPRRRAIFHGAPGTGKTTLAHHLAARLGFPMLKVRSENIVDSYVGASAQNMGNLFTAVETYLEEHPLVLFFDEIDSVASKRITEGGGRNAGANNQHNQMVNTLLNRMEELGGLMIGATNHAQSLDPAVWRRFEIQIELDVPSVGELKPILARYLKPFVLPEQCHRQLAESFVTASPALVRQFCENLKRHIVIGPDLEWDMSKDGTIASVLSAIEPHPDLGKPRLWAHRNEDIAVKNMPWPLERTLESYATEQPVVEKQAAPTTAEIVKPDFGAGRAR